MKGLKTEYERAVVRGFRGLCWGSVDDDGGVFVLSARCSESRG